MPLLFWRSAERRPDGREELEKARQQLERIECISSTHEKVLEEIERRREENHIAAALEAWWRTPRRSHP